MKRVVTYTAFAALAFAIAFTSVMMASRSSQAESDRSIPFQVSDLYPDGNSLHSGDSCHIRFPSMSPYVNDQQVLVRDESDKIIAIRTLDGATFRQSDVPGSLALYCELAFSLNVPEATFYTVYIGDERVVSYSRDQFPIDPSDGVRVSLFGD